LKPSPPKKRAGREPEPVKVLNPLHRWTFRLVAIVVIPLVLLGGLEAMLRLGGMGYSPGIFKRIHAGNGDFLGNNDDFSLRFFPAQLARFPGPIRMAASKSPDTYRVFILGESAAMGDPEPAYAASRYLDALLSARYPQTHFEIINLGITAINSHVILPIARDCARQGGDLWIIYMGNNEMVGPFGAATVFGAKAPPLEMIRLNLAIQKTRLGQLLVNLGQKLKDRQGGATAWGGMEMFVGNQLPADDPRKKMVYQNFAQNLDDIVKAGLDSGAKILLNTVAVNLKDCAPFASLSNSHLPAVDRAQFDQLFAHGVQAENQSNFPEAVKQFELAAKLDPQNAELQYRLGQSLLALGNTDDAREHLQRACDDDALPFRADSRINAIIGNEQPKAGSGNLTCFDAAAALAAGTPDKIVGAETLFEHVHFNFDGNYRLGRAWAEQVGKILPNAISQKAATNDWETQAMCERRLGLSDWNRALVIQSVVERMQLPPLSSQLGNDMRMNHLQAGLTRLHSQMNLAAAATSKADFQAVLAEFPEDYCVHENYGLFLQSIGDLPAAAAQCHLVHDLIPQDGIADYQLGHLLGIEGQWAEAGFYLQAAVKTRPSLTAGWIELGNVLAAQDQFAGALASYATALKQVPQNWQAHFRTGKVLAKLSRHVEAMESYRAAIRFNPANWEPHFELGGELDAAGQWDAARTEFGEAVRLNPGDARAHLNLGVLLAKQNRFAEAQHEFEEAVRLEPTYTKAQAYLAQIRGLKPHGP
jgi:tetratricopeptide (TPR) repeat protein